jgi:uncharacterized RDD family membrane protein YckC
MLGLGVRGARSAARATGIDKAVEVAAEEAMVSAIESEAVERALVRVLQGPIVEEAVHGALESETLKRALIDALDSEMVDEIWRRLLASEETQRLVERIAEAPELRAAISAQSMGMIEDIGRRLGDGARRLDSIVERVARRVLFRRPRTLATERAGAATRALAFGLDALIVNLAFSGLAALAGLIASAIWGPGDGIPAAAIAVGSFAWIAFGATYLVALWSLAGQTLGMRFFGIRLGVEGEGLPLRASLRRLVGLALAVIPFGLGLLGIVLDDRRRGWQDRMAGVDVVYERFERSTAPWSTLDAAESVPRTATGVSSPAV